MSRNVTVNVLALLAVIGSLATAPGARAAAAISPAAVAQAVAFWQSYSATPVCPAGVTIHQVMPAGYEGSTPGPAAVTRTPDGSFIPNCDMYADPLVATLDPEYQCAWAARNIGATFMGLDFNHDRTNVMYADGWVIPGSCKPDSKSRHRPHHRS